MGKGDGEEEAGKGDEEKGTVHMKLQHIAN